MEKLDAFTRYLGNCGLFHFFDAIQKWVLVFTGIIVFVLTIATVFLRYVLTMNVLGLDEIILLVIFWQYFIGAAQGSREDSQIKADMVSTVVKNKTVVAWCHLLARIIECGVIGVCIKWSIDYILKDMLKGKDIRQSMSRKGNCLDNAVVENFFGLLKSELLYLQKFASIEQFKTELVSYLEYYNNRRIKLSPGGLPPAVHRCKTLGAA